MLTACGSSRKYGGTASVVAFLPATSPYSLMATLGLLESYTDENSKALLIVFGIIVTLELSGFVSSEDVDALDMDSCE